MSSPREKSIVLVTVSGYDKPGITSSLTETLAAGQVTVLDIAQAVIHDVLTLSILFEMERDPGEEIPASETMRELRARAGQLGLKLGYEVMEARAASRRTQVSQRPYRYAVTLIADRITAAALNRVSRALAAAAINIDVIERLSEGDFGAVEMMVSSLREADLRALKGELLEIARQHEVDIAIQAEGLYRRAKRLVVMDMDSTLIQAEVIDELAREKGVYDEVAAITHEAMAGKLDFNESLARRCSKLQGLKLPDLERVYSRIELTPGARDLIHVLKKLGYKIALISGGFTFVAERLKETLGIDFVYANVLEIRDGALTGKVTGPIVNAQRKADLLDVIAQQEKIELDQVIAVGDGANDLLMLEKAGLGIAFNAKPAVRERADLALSRKNLRSILYLVGLSGRDLEEAGLKN